MQVMWKQQKEIDKYLKAHLPLKYMIKKYNRNKTEKYEAKLCLDAMKIEK